MGEQPNWDPTRDLRTQGLDVLHVNVELDGKNALKGILFNLHPGELCAVIGPFRFDKRLLMDVLLGIQAPTSGEVLLGGQSGVPAGSVGFIPADDGLHDNLSVRQSLELAARLRLSHLDSPSRRKRVIDVTNEVGLARFFAKAVGELSPEQRKRVAVGIEMLTEPYLLIVDEPLAGLNDESAGEILMLLQRTAQRGTVVLVMTAPHESLRRCDSLIVLYAGRVAYFGPPEESFEYFGCHQILDLQGELERSSPVVWHQRCRTSMWNSQFMVRKAPGTIVGPASLSLDARRAMQGRLPGSALQLVVMVQRGAMASIGDGKRLAAWLALGGAVSLALGVLSRSVRDDDALRYLFVWAGYTVGLFAGASRVAHDRPIVAREHMAGLSLWAGYGATLLVLLVMGALQGLVGAAFGWFLLSSWSLLGPWAGFTGAAACGAGMGLVAGSRPTRDNRIVLGIALLVVQALGMPGSPLSSLFIGLVPVGWAYSMMDGVSVYSAITVFGVAWLGMVVAIASVPASLESERAMARADLIED